MAKKEKKVDLKKVAKQELSARIAEFLKAEGYDVNAESERFGFTEGTLVISKPETDVQVKFITPKAGETQYKVLPEGEQLQRGGYSPPLYIKKAFTANFF